MKRTVLMLVLTVSLMCCILGLVACNSHTHAMAHREAKAATCTTDGNIEYYECTDCKKCFADEHASKEIDPSSVKVAATGHNPQTVQAVPQTCTTDGLTEGSQCSNCSEILTAQSTIPATGHKDANNDCKCDVCQEPLPHTDADHNCLCDKCNTQLQHSEETIPAVAATCTTDGSTAGKKCSVCDTVLQAPESIPALGHKDADHNCVCDTCETALPHVDEDSNCVCDVCETQLAHQEEEIAAQAPTCTEDGTTAGKKCSVCGTVLQEPEVDPATGHEYENGECIHCGKKQQTEGLEYNLYKTFCVVSGIGTATDTEIYIPSEHEGLPVVSLQTAAFSNNKNITLVVLPDSITDIGDNSFENCTKLESVVIPDTVTSIGSAAFKGCTSLKSVTIPEGVTRLYETFYNCTALTEINYNAIEVTNGNTFNNNFTYAGSEGSGITLNIGAKVKMLPSCMFYVSESKNAANITKVVFAENGVLQTIGSQAFQNSKYLTEIALPDTVTSIGSDAFLGCQTLATVKLPQNLQSLGSAAFGSTAVTSVVLPESITSIYANTFNNCSKLEYNVYDNASYLGTAENPYFALITTTRTTTTCEIHKDTVLIATSAFSGRVLLTSITVPEGVKYVGDEAFSGCTALEKVTLPNSLETIGTNVFKQNSSLKFSTYGIGNYLGNEENPFLVLVRANADESVSTPTIHEDTRFIMSSAFANNTAITSIVIPDKVKYIGSSAFYGCNALENVTIGSSVKTIGSSAFYNCSALQSVTIGSSVESIGAYAFKNTAIKEVTIPQSVKLIGSGAFQDCKNLTSVTFEVTKGWIWESTDSSSLSWSKPVNQEDIENPETIALILSNSYSYCQLVLTDE